MRLPHELVTVTPLSKLLVLILLITLPIFSFILGMKYQTMIDDSSIQTNDNSYLVKKTGIAPTTPIITTPIPHVDITNWKTYTNDDLNITFKYPSDWLIQYSNNKQSLKMCDKYPVYPTLAPQPGVKFGACEGSDVTPTASIVVNYLLDISPQSLTDNRNPPIQLFYYENPNNVTIEEFNDRYLSLPVAGDPISIWAPTYEERTNSFGIKAYYDKEHYCVARCQVYVWLGKRKIFILKNFPLHLDNQQEIYDKIFSSFQFLN